MDGEGRRLLANPEEVRLELITDPQGTQNYASFTTPTSTNTNNTNTDALLRRRGPTPELANDVAKGLFHVHEAIRLAQSEQTEFWNQLISENHSSSAVLQQLRQRLHQAQRGQATLDGRHQEQCLWEARSTIFHNWLSVVEDHISVAYPSLQPSLESLRNAFDSVFRYSATQHYGQHQLQDVLDPVAPLRRPSRVERPPAAVLREISHLLEDGIVLPDAPGDTVQALTEELLGDMELRQCLSARHTNQVREQLATLLRPPHSACYLDSRVALLSCYLEPGDETEALATGTVLGLARARHAVVMDDRDEVEFVVLVVAERSLQNAVEPLVLHVANLMHDRDFLQEVLRGATKEHVLLALELQIGRMLLGARDDEDEELDEWETGFNSKGCCRGLVDDVRRRGRWFKSDFTDGFNVDTLSASAFLFVACFAPALAMGGSLGLDTDSQMSVIETILATGMSCVMFTFAGGQPLMILGFTGPVLVYIGVMYQISEAMDEAFLPLYACSGLWASLFLMLATLCNWSNYMRLCTRFTDEIFAALVSLIFIVEPLQHLAQLLADGEVEVATKASYLLLVLGTTWLAFAFKGLQYSIYWRHWIRKFVSSFAPVLALIAAALLAHTVLNGVDLGFVDLPDDAADFKPTQPRPWLVNPTEVSTAGFFVSIALGLLGAILLFLDEHISTRVLYKPANKLRKGPGYHMDLLVVAVCTAVLSLLGMPWMVSTTVRSIAHFFSVATTRLTKSANSMTQTTEVVAVIETRVTGLLVGVLMFVSVFAAPILQLIPMASLDGIFLFMGLGCLRGNQFVDRLKFMCTDQSVTKDLQFAIPFRSVLKYTLIQVAALAALWLVKISVAAVAFPLLLLLLIPLRKLMGRWWFTEQELGVLDQ